MRLARKRSLARRPGLQVGFGITFGVFLALMGLIVFERIILFYGIIGFGYQPATDMQLFKYGPEGAMGPWDWMAIILGVLFFAQCYRAWKAWQHSETSLAGIAFGLCNIGMMVLLTLGLLINWAFYNPLNPGAAQINSLANISWARTEYYSPIPFDDEQQRYEYGWEKLDTQTYQHTEIGLIERQEIIKADFPIDIQRANFLARHPDKPEAFADRSVYATHYYDLDGNLLTIMASDRWPIVKARLAQAQQTAWDETGQVSRKIIAYNRARERTRPFTYEEILEMVEASWDGIALEPAPELDTP